MKKNFMYAFLSAIALSGSIGLASCASDSEEVVEVNPNYNPETNEVQTNFVFNVAMGGNTATTRMSAANVQENSVSNRFRGMEHAALLTFHLGAAASGGAIATSSESEATRLFSLGNVLGNNAIDGSTTSNKILSLALPVNTNTLVFYAKAAKTTTDAEQGNITFSPASKLSDINFALSSRLDGQTAKLTQYEYCLSSIMTRVAQTGLVDPNAYDFYFNASTGQVVEANAIKSDSNPSGTDVSDTDTWKEYKGQLAWAQYGQAFADGTTGYKAANYPTQENYNALKGSGSDYLKFTDLKPLTAQGEELGNAYNTLILINDGEVRAGSSAAIERSIADLLGIVKSVRDFYDTKTPESWKEVIDKKMADRLWTRVTTYFAEAGTLKDISTLRSAFQSYVSGYNTSEVSKNMSMLGNVNNFPIDLNLPMGAAQLNYAPATRTYSYGSDNLNLGNVGTDIAKIMYPAELTYFGNSPIRVSESNTIEDNDFPNGSTNWLDTNNWPTTGDKAWKSDSYVQSTTKHVAMQNNINYGTAMFETTVKLSANTIHDNRKKFYEEEGDAAITPNFELTGILIGGQSEKVDWHFLPTTPSEGYSYVIYDNAIPSATAISTTASAANYTLLFDNYSTKDDNKDVLVALELKNNGADFWGRDNLIRRGGTFYLVGKLERDNGTGDIAWPKDTDKYNIPPYTNDGKTDENAKRIFIQDFVTKANFTIGDTSLKNAFVTVPNLQSTQMTLGLSVDLTWRAGLTFNDVELGKQ